MREKRRASYPQTGSTARPSRERDTEREGVYRIRCFSPHRFRLKNTAKTVKLLVYIYCDLTQTITFRYYTIVNLILFYVLQDTIRKIYNVNVY